MTNQSNEAAERSAHVTRGSAPTTSDSVMLEVSPGVFKLRVLVEAEHEIEMLKADVASLRLTLGGRTFSNNIPEPIGCPIPGACAQVAEIKRLRDALYKIAHSADYGSIISPDGDMHEEAIQTALDALG
jgi:hypothetical protein